MPERRNSLLSDSCSIVLTGDAVITRRMPDFDDPSYKGMLDIIRNADAAFTDLEVTLFDPATFGGYPQAEAGGWYQAASPDVAQNLKSIGFRLISTANNHVADYGIEGMLSTSRHLDSLGIVHAGTGMNLSDASAPRYLDTPAGRIADKTRQSWFNTRH